MERRIHGVCALCPHYAQLTQRLALNPAAYVEPVENELQRAYQVPNTAIKDAKEPAQLLWPVLKALKQPINAYFEKVLINAEDETLRKARLALVQQIALLPASVGDLSKLQSF